MNKKFLSVMLLATFILGSLSFFTACSDDDTVYDDTSVTSQISSLSSQLSTLQSALSEAQSTADAAASAAASASTAAQAASSLAESAAAQAKAEAIEEAIEETKALIAAAQSTTDEEIATLSLLIEGIDSNLNELSDFLSSVSDDVKANATAIAALQVQMTAVEKYKEDIEALNGDVSALDASIEDIQEKLATLTSTVDGKCTMDEVKSYIAQVLSGDTQVVYTKDEVNDLLDVVVDRILDIQSELLTLKTDKLTSLVFIPELYVNGIEATRYAYAAGYGFMGNSTQASGTYDGQAYSFTKDAVDAFSIGTTAAYYYSLTPSMKTSYRYNPSSAVLSGVTFGFDVLNVESISRSEAAWSANVDSTEVNAKGILDVYYKISSPEKLVDPKDGEVPVMSLKATLANDTTVNSDYAAVVPTQRSLNYIAFTKASGYTTKNAGCNDNYDLYRTGSNAAENVPSISWAYNGGTLNLESLLCIHYAQADYGDYTDPTACDGIMTIEELETWGLSLKFEALPYLIGINETDQSAYCFVTEDGEFTPAYIPDGGTVSDKTAIAEGSTTGKSSIGRIPIVLVKLVDANGVVISYGYVKILIDEVTTSPTTTDRSKVVQESTYAFDCDTENAEVYWDNISANLYQYLNMSAASFRNTYTAQSDTYIMKSDGSFEVSTAYGTIAETVDTGDATTTVLKATIDADQKVAIYTLSNHTQTIYIRYSNASGTSNVYVGFTITIADLPTVTFTERIGSQWVGNEDGALEDGNETKWNVPAPGTPGKTVYDYTKTLDSLFYNQKVVATLSNTTLYKATEVGYTYSFAPTADQDKIGKYTLYVSTDGLSLYAAASMTSQYLVAEITEPGTGKIEYANTDVAKEILNLYSHSSETLAYAKVMLTATYGSCKRELEDRTFIVDFIRPIDIVAGQDATFEDATANGSSVSLANLISITDWRDKPVYNKSYPNGYSDNGVNLFDYYEFEEITVDLANAKYNGTSYTASQASIVLSLVDKNGDALSSNTQTITSASDLSGIYIKQYNNSTVSSEYTLQIPIEVTYSWGTVSYTINATVNHTIAN